MHISAAQCTAKATPVCPVEPVDLHRQRNRRGKLLRRNGKSGCEHGFFAKQLKADKWVCKV